MAGDRVQRIRSLTDSCPKPMALINGKPILEFIIQQFISIGLDQLYLSVNYLNHHIKDHFSDVSSLGASIKYIEEDEPFGTAGALSLLSNSLNGNLWLVNCDILSRIDY